MNQSLNDSYPVTTPTKVMLTCDFYVFKNLLVAILCKYVTLFYNNDSSWNYCRFMVPTVSQAQ